MVQSAVLGTTDGNPLTITIGDQTFSASLLPSGVIKGSKIYEVPPGQGWSSLRQKLPPVLVDRFEKTYRPSGLLPKPWYLGWELVGHLDSNNNIYLVFPPETVMRTKLQDARQVAVAFKQKPDDAIGDLIDSIFGKTCLIAPVGLAVTGNIEASAAVSTGCAIYQGSSAQGTTGTVTAGSPKTPAAARGYKGTIAAYDPSIRRYRVAWPIGRSLSGSDPLGAAPYQEGETTGTLPADSTLVSLTQYQHQTGTSPWYKRPLTYVVAGGVVLAGGALWMVRRRRHRRRRR